MTNLTVFLKLITDNDKKETAKGKRAQKRLTSRSNFLTKH
jgi:hypothetical protein